MKERGPESSKLIDRFCPWCETIYKVEADKAGPLCSECRADLMERPKEFLVTMLGHVAGVNALLMAERGQPPDLRRKQGAATALRRTPTLKELAKNQKAN